MTDQEIRDYLSEIDDEIVVLDGFDEAIIGLDTNNRLIYDHDRMVETMMERDSCTEEDALEWIAYNTIPTCDYLGEKGPIIMTIKFGE